MCGKGLVCMCFAPCLSLDMPPLGLYISPHTWICTRVCRFVCVHSSVSIFVSACFYMYLSESVSLFLFISLYFLGVSASLHTWAVSSPLVSLSAGLCAHVCLYVSLVFLSDISISQHASVISMSPLSTAHQPRHVASQFVFCVYPGMRIYIFFCVQLSPMSFFLGFTASPLLSPFPCSHHTTLPSVSWDPDRPKFEAQICLISHTAG